MCFSHATPRFIGFLTTISHASTTVCFSLKIRHFLFCFRRNHSNHFQTFTYHHALSTVLSESFRGLASFLRTLIPETSSSFRSAESEGAAGWVTSRRAGDIEPGPAGLGCPTAAMCRGHFYHNRIRSNRTCRKLIHYIVTHQVKGELLLNTVFKSQL